MASYGVIVTDNLDGSFKITACNRGTTTTTFTGGTNLLTNTFTQNAATGALLTASGFLTAATDINDGLGHKMKSPQEALQRAIAYVSDDRAWNG